MTEPLRRRQPSDNLDELQGQLLQTLSLLEEDRLQQPELVRAYAQHAQVLAWRRVADGHMGAPVEALDCLRAAEPFIGRNAPDLEPLAAAALEIYIVCQSLALAAEALAKRRVEDRLSEPRSEIERAILQVLAEHRGIFLRRGEILERLTENNRPTPPRVGQILAELHEENVVLRIHGRAQGNPNAAFYALSPRGVELCRDLGLIREEGEDDLPLPILEAVEIACDPALYWERRRVAHGVLATEGLGPRNTSILKVLLAKKESNPDSRVRTLVDEAIKEVVTASSAPHVQAKGRQDSKVLFSQKPQEEPQLAELAFA